MTLKLASVCILTAVLSSGCMIVSDDKPANSAPAATTDPAPAPAATREYMKPPPRRDLGDAG